MGTYLFRNGIVCKSLLLALVVLTFSWNVAAQTAIGPQHIATIADGGNFSPLHGNTHPLARQEFDHGLATDSLTLPRILLVLQRTLEREGALQRLVKEQQDSSSSNYHAWLTPEQFGKQFGPADEDIETLTQWLTSHGFTDIKVGPGRTAIEFSGNVASIRNAFHTQIHRYLVNGNEHIANASDPQIPAAFKPVVAGIVSLHDFRKKPMYRLAGTSRSATLATGLTMPNP